MTARGALSELIRLINGEGHNIDNTVQFTRGQCYICETSNSKAVHIRDTTYNLCTQHMEMFSRLTFLFNQDFKELAFMSSGYPTLSCCICSKPMDDQYKIGDKVIMPPLDTNDFMEYNPNQTEIVICENCDGTLTDEVARYPHIIDLDYAKCPKCSLSFSVTAAEMDYEKMYGIEGSVYCQDCLHKLKKSSEFKAFNEALSQSFTQRYYYNFCGICQKDVEHDLHLAGTKRGCDKCIHRDYGWCLELIELNPYRYELSANGAFLQHFTDDDQSTAFNAALDYLITIRKAHNDKKNAAKYKSNTSSK